jgi:hypothetical protein
VYFIKINMSAVSYGRTPSVPVVQEVSENKVVAILENIFGPKND